MGSRESTKESDLVKVHLVVHSKNVNTIKEKCGAYFSDERAINNLANRGSPVGKFQIYFQNGKLLPNYIKLPNGNIINFYDSDLEDSKDLVAEGELNPQVAESLKVFFNRYRYQMNVLCCEQSADLEKEGLLLSYVFNGQRFRFPRLGSGNSLYPLHYTKSS